MTVLPRKHYCRYKSTEEEVDQKLHGKESRERNVHGRFQVQLEEDRGRTGWGQVVSHLSSTWRDKAL